MTTETPETLESDATAGDLEWLSLEDGEEIIWAGGPDRRTLLPAFLIGIPLAIVLIGILIIVGEYLRITNTNYVVTTRAVYRKSGVLSRDVKRIEHEKVQDISYTQSALGNHFGYGTVEVSTAGGAGVEMAFSSVPNPRDVQHLIGDQRKRSRSSAGSRDRDADRPAEDVLEEICTELREIRTLLEESAGPSRGPSESESDHETTRAGSSGPRSR